MSVDSARSRDSAELVQFGLRIATETSERGARLKQLATILSARQTELSEIIVAEAGVCTQILEPLLPAPL